MKALRAATALQVLMLTSAVARADVSANVGFASDYWFRGIFQSTSSASGGLDYASEAGFYAGTWAADVGDGLEVDGYFGWSGEFEDVSVGLGFTGYYYTGDFDDTYQEINLSGGYGIATLDVAVGEYDNFDGPTQDYTYYSLTLEQHGFYGKYAGFTQDADGQYLEFGYGFDYEGIDFGLAVILADDEQPASETDEALVFSIGKTFELQ